jgi:alpha-beta hydrolase superfamily lysophospholipase
MQKTVARRIRRWVIVLLTIYVLGGALIYFFQDKVLFRPEELPADHAYNFPGPFKEINLDVGPDKKLAIVQFTVPDSMCKGVVLYFHGNKRNIERYAPLASYFTKNNYEVWMMDYPGYGKSTGERTEAILYEDALTLYKMARSRFAKDSIVLYGKSLGTGIASQLASVRDCRKLILETPYYDFPSMLRQYLPVYPGWLIRYKFPTHEYLPKVTAPITIFHGTKDGVIRYSNAKKLKPFLKKTDEFITIEGGSHNDLYESDKILQKLDSLLSR